MAEKEATVYIVDLGMSMKDCHYGRDQTDLDWALTYVWDRITSTVALDRKTTFQAVIGLKTDRTSNELEADPSFGNITVFQELNQLLLPDLKILRDQLMPSNTSLGDAISAIVIAIQMIEKKCKKLKYIRRIVLVTNGREELDGDQTAEISAKIKEEGIQLTVLGVDFDDEDYGFKEEAKDPAKSRNERILASLVESCNGVIGTLAQAAQELGVPRLKSVRPVPSYRRELTVGDGDRYSDALSIEVERYPRVMIRSAPSASSYVVKSEVANGTDTAQSSVNVVDEPNGEADQNPLAPLRTERLYEIKDESAADGKRVVPQTDLEKGYEYGRTAVYISESDKSLLNVDSKESLAIVGFIPWSKFERYMGMSTTNVIIGSPKNTKAIMALSSLIHALQELESFAIGRFVRKEGQGPLLLLLAPSIEPDFECLIDIQLPFAEDVRQYRFPPLDRVVTVSGKSLRQHRFLPNDALVDAMDAYVDAMDLSTLDVDEDGNPTEYAAIQDTYSPLVHRIDQVVRFRAVHADQPIPPPHAILTKYSHPPAQLVEESKDQLQALKDAADVRPAERKVPGRQQARGLQPISGLDVTTLVAEERGPGPRENREARTVYVVGHVMRREHAREAQRAKGGEDVVLVDPAVIVDHSAVEAHAALRVVVGTAVDPHGNAGTFDDIRRVGQDDPARVADRHGGVVDVMRPEVERIASRRHQLQEPYGIVHVIEHARADDEVVSAGVALQPFDEIAEEEARPRQPEDFLGDQAAHVGELVRLDRENTGAEAFELGGMAALQRPELQDRAPVETAETFGQPDHADIAVGAERAGDDAGEAGAPAGHGIDGVLRVRCALLVAVEDAAEIAAGARAGAKGPLQAAGEIAQQRRPRCKAHGVRLGSPPPLVHLRRDAGDAGRR